MLRVSALRETLTAYDATYLALVEALSDPGAALLTSDDRFAAAIVASSDVEALLVT